MENSCPQCKQKIHKITYVDMLGRTKTLPIEDKVQEVDNFEDMYCEVCRERVYERNFDARDRDADSAAICEECLDKSIHLRCMSAIVRQDWEEDRIWLCQECLDSMSSDDDGEVVSDDSELIMGLNDPEMFQ